jgi:excisionase family DNA binding protein
VNASVSTGADLSMPQVPAPAIQGPEVFINRKELARRLNSGVRTIDSWTAKGLIPFYKIGGKSVLFKWSEVEAHLRDTCRRNR